MSSSTACAHPRVMTGASGHDICTDCGSTLGAADITAAQQADRMYVATTPSLPGFRVAGTRGIVGGAVVEGIGFGGDLLAGLANSFGGRADSFEQGLAQARAQVLTQMKREAYARGGNALIGVTFDQQLMSGASGGASMLMVAGTATAAVIEPEAAETSKSQG